MVSPLWWVAGGMVAFTLVATGLEWRGRLPEWVSVAGPFVTLRSDRGRSVLDWFGRPVRGWRAFTTVGIAAVAGLSVVMTAGVVLAAVLTVLDPAGSPVDSPAAALVVPGVNQFLPLSAAPGLLVAVLGGLLVHEGCHGVLCRIEDIEIADVGVVLFTLVPIGAFVQPAEQAVEGRGGWARMFAAGPAGSLAVTAVSFCLLVVCLSAIAPAAGVAVGGTFEGAPAAAAGIDAGDRITAVDGTTVDDREALDRALAGANESVLVKRAGATPTRVDRSVTVVAADGPVALSAGASVSAVNGTSVATEQQFRAALADRPVARLAVDGDTVVAPLGVSGTVTEDGALAAAGVPTGNVTITALNGTRTLDLGDVQAVLENASAGEPLPVTLVRDGQRETYTVEPRAGEDGRLLVGIVPDPGISGLTLTDFGVGTYPAQRYLSVLSGGGVEDFDGLVGRLVTFLTLPLATLVGTAPYNFAGFQGPLAAAFTVEGPLAALGGGVFALANVAFWLTWLNVQVALFNCLPLYPLDGGRLLRTGVVAAGDRMGVADPERLGTVVAGAVGVVVVALLLAVVVVPVVG